MPRRKIEYTPELCEQFARRYAVTLDPARAYAETFKTRGKEENARAGTELLGLVHVQAWVRHAREEMAAGAVGHLGAVLESARVVERVKDTGKQLEIREETTAPSGNLVDTDTEMLAILAAEARTAASSPARVQAAAGYLKLRQLVEREQDGEDVPTELATFIEEERIRRCA